MTPETIARYRFLCTVEGNLFAPADVLKLCDALEAAATRLVGKANTKAALARVREAVAAINKADRECPVRSSKRTVEECSRCGATSRDSCGPSTNAAFALVAPVTELLALAEAPAWRPSPLQIAAIIDPAFWYSRVKTKPFGRDKQSLLPGQTPADLESHPSMVKARAILALQPEPVAVQEGA